jgi:geranylgeranyl diphosphate synthase type II
MSDLPQHSIEQLLEVLEERLSIVKIDGTPDELYGPARYMLTLGGKRVRPVVALAACEMFGQPYSEALHQAIGIEIFHNFTLVHDDIMDAADMRRGKTTVHKKWDTPTAILSGDAMVIMAYQYLMKNAGDNLQELIQHFNATAIKVCEGQQMDMNFQSCDEVKLSDYIEMIRKKTAVLFGESLRIGAIMAGASTVDAHLLYDVGVNLGIAFQIQDDLLDTFGDPLKFGKKVGGDIIARKKTYLYVKALELLSLADRQSFIEEYNNTALPQEQKIVEITAIFDRLNLRDLTRAEMNRFFIAGAMAMNAVELPEHRKAIIKDFVSRLMVREV